MSQFFQTGTGYVWDITEAHQLDVYGRYTWTRVQGYVGQKQGISGSCNVMYEF